MEQNLSIIAREIITELKKGTKKAIKTNTGRRQLNVKAGYAIKEHEVISIFSFIFSISGLV
jgi:hypothetical protein